MDGWWVDRFMGEQMDLWVNGWVVGGYMGWWMSMGEQMDLWVNGWVMDGWMNRFMDGWVVDGFMGE